MYEYVHTERGWVLYWGAAVLHRKAPEQPRLLPIEIDRTTAAAPIAANREPPKRLSA